MIVLDHLHVHNMQVLFSSKSKIEVVNARARGVRGPPWFSRVGSLRDEIIAHTPLPHIITHEPAVFSWGENGLVRA